MRTCPVCNGSNIKNMLETDLIPVMQNVVYKTSEEALGLACGNISLTLCDDCGFIFNAGFIDGDVFYDENYDNNQSLSATFDKYLEEQINWLKDNYIGIDDTIVEIGCGKGYYIRRLAQLVDGKGGKYGFDTSYSGCAEPPTKGLKYFKHYFSEEYLSLDIDLAICRHVIEHIHNPLEFLKMIRGALRRGTLLFIETPNIQWIIENNVFYDINYEHCSYFTYNSLTRALELAGFEVIEKKGDDFGGQYMQFVARASDCVDRNNDLSITFKDKLTTFIDEYKIWKDRYVSVFQQHKKANGITAVWGAGAKGNILLNSIDKKRTLIDYVIDINPNKQYKYLGGTGHLIIPPKDIEKNGITDILILNPNYYDEISAGITGINLFI